MALWDDFLQPQMIKQRSYEQQQQKLLLPSFLQLAIPPKNTVTNVLIDSLIRQVLYSIQITIIITLTMTTAKTRTATATKHTMTFNRFHRPP
jgi:hypothetical protein